MKNVKTRLIALCLALCMTLSGCSGLDFGGYFENLFNYLFSTTSFDDMEYTRPDLDAHQAALDTICNLAATETDIDMLMDGIWAYYDVYDAFSTSYALANIRYCQDMTDSYWEAEYNYCTENIAVADAGLDTLYRALAKSPLLETLEGDDYFGAGFFDYYQESDSVYDAVFLELLEEEAQLVNEYYAISADAADTEYYSEEFFTAFGPQLAQLYVELIALRQEMAAHLGYDSYISFAYDFYYYRDYTPQQAEGYLASIQKELSPLYREFSADPYWEIPMDASSEQETFAYVRSMAKNMGGSIKDAFDVMEEGGLYDISYNPNKYATSFEIYLPSYYVPFVFVCPDGSAYDRLVFSHEFGHFCSDYHSYGSVAGVDVAEIFSQGMEYLSLCYADGGKDLVKDKMADCLCLYVEQAALASFEQQVYALSSEKLSVEAVEALYASVSADFGLDTEDWDSRSYLCIPHYFTNPMYVISYVVSNDAALQLYEMELQQEGKGLACLESNLTTAQAYFLSFLEEAGLQSPFEEGRLSQVRQLLQDRLS